MLPVYQFKQFVDQNQLFGPNGTILATVSGGMDSVLMAHLLKAAGYNFALAHCNFKLRAAESDADETFCQNLADQLSVPWHSISFNTANYASTKKISIQMAARQLRYDWFDQLRTEYGYAAIALAHHQNDAAETILLNLTRGTGIAGLHGIFPKNGRLVRPMLFLSRQEIENTMQENNLAWREDSSNSSVKYARNKIRLEVIPRLKELNPALEQTFESDLQHFRDLEILLEQETGRQREHLIKHNDERHLPLNAIKKMRPQQLLLYSLLYPYGFNGGQVRSVIASLDRHPGRMFESSSHKLLLDRDKLIIAEKKIERTPAATIEANSDEIIYGDYKLVLLHNDLPIIIKNNPLAASVDVALLHYPLTLRPWRQGDHFQPLGMTGRQKLSDFFIHQKIPLHHKTKVPVLVNSNGEIIWLAGHRLDDRYKVTPATKKVVIFELLKQA